MPNNEDTDYTPSQGYTDTSNLDIQDCHALRLPEQTSTRSKLKNLYCTGGALDSQTTDSQYVEGLIQDSNSTKARGSAYQVKKLRTRWRRLALIGKNGHAGPCICYEYRVNSAKLLLLQQKVEQLEAALDETRRELSSVIMSSSYSTSVQSPMADRTVSQPQDNPKHSDSDYNSEYENGKILLPTQYGMMWMAASEESQLEVSPPHPRPRLQCSRNLDTSCAPISRLREVHNGEKVEYYASQTQL
ncbi:hypothetical protein BDY19DRAFT_998910 [Irpex rosettiformis]|uniref:Uncharacterized protein n=1 Tax=Irpex rosettiformis TaxID=378272 RepID=A0ACB8TM10_9APHY|nr:hypothetical protein BDY19DRAFT_998910 [Irpex rosettiformis]